MTARTAEGAFVVEREIQIDAPRETVFSLLASREGMARWIPASLFEPRVGGRIEFTFRRDGSDWISFGEITRLEPPERIAFTWDRLRETLGAVTEVQFELVPNNGGTLVRLTHTGFIDETQRAEHEHGWTYFGDRLKVAAEGGEPEADDHTLAARHRDALEALVHEEAALTQHVERVAEMRRNVPLGEPLAKEYDLHEDERTVVKFSDLFGKRDDLLVYHLMFAPDDELPCPMCSMWVDGYNAIVRHVRPRAEFVVIAKAPIGKLRAFAKQRGWNQIRLLSSYGTTFNSDFGVEDRDGDQLPSISSFCRRNGEIYHFYQKRVGDGDRVRGIDLYTPVWNLFDLLPDGRGEGNAQHVYPE